MGGWALIQVKVRQPPSSAQAGGQEGWRDALSTRPAFYPVRCAYRPRLCSVQQPPMQPCPAEGSGRSGPGQSPRLAEGRRPRWSMCVFGSSQKPFPGRVSGQQHGTVGSSVGLWPHVGIAQARQQQGMAVSKTGGACILNAAPDCYRKRSFAAQTRVTRARSAGVTNSRNRLALTGT